LGQLESQMGLLEESITGNTTRDVDTDTSTDGDHDA
jgi:hypothetical protein